MPKMDEDSARNSLFGGAAARNVGKTNPFAAGAENGTPNGDGSAKPAAGQQKEGTPLSEEDQARSSLLAGGRARKSVAVPTPVAAPAPPPPTQAEAEVPDDGEVTFDFDNLNLMEAMRSEGGAGNSGDGLAMEDLNFAAIDDDLSNFAQDEVIREALSSGIDLRVYSRQVDSELRHMEMLSIEDYVNEADAIAELFEQINSCEGVLTDMQSMLDSFQQNLGGISEEIRSLQEQSLSLSIEMANRKSLSGKVSTFLSKVSVPESLIVRIVDGNIDDAWLKDLHSLSEKIAFCTSGASGIGEPSSGGDFSLSDLTISPLYTPVGRESLPQLEKLKAAACAKLRSWFTRSIAELVKPKTNMSKQQEYILLRYAPAMVFLNEHGGDIGREIRSLYADQVGRYYNAIFKKYVEDLSKLLLALPRQADNIVDYNPAARLSAALAADPSLNGVPNPVVDPFALGERLHILSQIDAPAVASHVAQAEKMRFTFESLWRNVVRHFMDVSASEYSFIQKFFGEKLGGEMFTLTMSVAMSSLFEALENHLVNVYDAPGHMLLVALASAQRRMMMVDRHCDVLESFFDRVTLLLWPKFKAVLDENSKAVRLAKDSSKRSGSVDFNVHPITRRYAEFASSIMVLHRRLAVVHLSDDMLLHHLTALSRDMDALLQKLAGELSNKTTKIVFMVNNYSACLSIGQSRAVDAEDLSNWDRGADHYMNMYTDTELETYFRSLVAFVKKYEASVQAAAAAAGVALPTPAASGAGTTAVTPATILQVPDSVPVNIELGEADAVLRDFNSNWRNGVKSLADNVNRYFSASAGGLAVTLLKRVLSTFINTYERFTTLLSRGLPSSAPLLREVVNSQTIYFELRKYSRTE